MRYSINIPLATNEGTAFTGPAIAAIEDWLLSIFGGYTVSQGIGGWRDPETGIVYREAIAVYEMWADPSFDIDTGFAYLARSLRCSLEQEAIFLTVGGRHEIVTADTPPPNID